MEQSIWTFSNALSFVRLLLAIPIAFLLMPNDSACNVYAALLMIVAAITDLFDGMLARKLNQVTDFGKIIDPIADKIIVGVVSVILAGQGKIPIWFLVIVLLRDIVIFLGGMYVRKSKGIILQSNWTGKWAVTTVALYVLIVVFDIQTIPWLKEVFLVASTLMLALSFALYTRRFLSVVS
jgi:CDP-diacylglycerol--glycerol-3-phosphate 3-phosphatidyltransferase